MGGVRSPRPCEHVSRPCFMVGAAIGESRIQMDEKARREALPSDNSIVGRCISAAKGLLPVSLKRWIRTEQHRYSLRPPLGRVRFGTLKRLAPINPTFGIERGQGVDRYYIEIFLRKYIDDIRGDVLEVETSRYTRQFGGGRVARSDVLHAVSGNLQATLVGDLATGQGIHRDAFDCIILTQTLEFIYNFRGAVETVLSVLKPGGACWRPCPGSARSAAMIWSVGVSTGGLPLDRHGDSWRKCFRRSMFRSRCRGMSILRSHFYMGLRLKI